MRLGISSVGVVLTTLRSEFGMTEITAAIVTTAPVVCFSLVGLLASRIISRVGVQLTGIAVLAVITIALVGRALSPERVTFVVWTLALLAATAVGNVLLPIAGKRYFPDRLPSINALAGAAVVAGSSLGALGSGFVFGETDSWRVALGAWATVSLVSLLPWLGLMARGRYVGEEPGSGVGHGTTMRKTKSWQLALCFGLVSAQAYAQLGWFPAILIDAGLPYGEAGALLGLLTITGIPATLMLPWAMKHLSNRTVPPIIFGTSTALGWLGILVMPTTLTWLWAVLIGVGAGSFAWTLTMIAQHASTPRGSAELSSFTQGIGFLIAAVGPLGIEGLYLASGGWTWSVLALALIAGLMALTGSIVSRPWFVEDA
jgi:CP family cyanate transporter-like MFS transporter